MTEEATSSGKAWLVYDGECPFCSSYVKLVRIRESIGQLHLLDARTTHPVVDEVQEAGFDLDLGMVLKIGDRFYHGADCMHVLAKLSTRSGIINKINGAIFRSEVAARVIYPILRTGRNITLRLLGRRKISGARPIDAHRQQDSTIS